MLHESGITETGIGLAQGILFGAKAGLTTGLVAMCVSVHVLDARLVVKFGNILNTDDLEPLLGLGVDKVLAVNLKSGDSSGSAHQGKGSRKHTAVRLYHVSPRTFPHRGFHSFCYGISSIWILCCTYENHDEAIGEYRCK